MVNTRKLFAAGKPTAPNYVCINTKKLFVEAFQALIDQEVLGADTECLDGSVLVERADGALVPIRSLEGYVGTLAGSCSSGQEGSSLGVPVQVKGFVEKGAKSCYEVKSAYSPYTVASEKHLYFTQRGWVHTRDLTADDWLMVSCAERDRSDSGLSAEELELIGWFLAEGVKTDLCRGGVTLAVCEEEYASYVAERANVDPGKLACVRYAKNNTLSFRLKKKGRGHTNAAKQRLISWGLYSKYSWEKCIPAEVMRSSNRQISVVLRALFSADGTVFKNRVGLSWTTTSAQMASQVMLLLQRFGILSSCYRHVDKRKRSYKDCYSLQLNRCDALLFMEKIGLIGRKRREFEASVISHGGAREKSKRRVPPQVLHTFFEGLRKSGRATTEFLVQYKLYDAYYDSRSSVPLSAFKKACMAVGVWDVFEVLFPEGSVWSRVHTVDPVGERKVYDLTTDTHEFLADGLVVHNTSGFRHVDCHMIGVSFSWKPFQGIYLPCRHVSDDKNLNPEFMFEYLREHVYGNAEITKVWWNSKFDRKFLLREETGGITCRNNHDAMIMAHLLDENSPNKLKWHAKTYVVDDGDVYEKELNQFRLEYSRSHWVDDPTLKAGKRKMRKDEVHYGYVPLRIMVPYAASDTSYTLELYKMYGPRVDEENLRQLYTDELELMGVLVDIENQGALIDVDYCHRKADELLKETTETEKDFQQRARKVMLRKFRREFEGTDEELKAALDSPKVQKSLTVNIGSNKQLAELFRASRIKVPQKKRANGKFTDCLDKDALKQLAEKGKVLPQQVLDYRQKEKIRNTYLAALPALVQSDGMIHGDNNIVGTATGRSSQSNPNLMNQPRGPLVRSAFVVPSDEYIWVKIDFCLEENTGVMTPTGTVPIKDLREGDLVYSYNHKKDKVRCSKVSRHVCTGRKKTLVVVLDNGERVRCTPEHRWLDLQGNEVFAKDLKPGHRLLPFRKFCAGQNRDRVCLYSHSSYNHSYEQVEVARAALGKRPKGWEVHHKDESPWNNDPANLEYRERVQHRSEHARGQALAQWADEGSRQKLVDGVRRGVADRRSYEGEGNPNFGKKTGIEKVCPVCKETFYCYPSQKTKKFCSSACYHESRNHKVLGVIDDGLVVRTYDIEVEKDHNFALSAGVFVHNSQVELRLAAEWSKDPVLTHAYQNGIDVHAMMGQQLVEMAGGDWHKLSDEEKKMYRRRAKAVNFGFLYGMQGDKFVDYARTAYGVVLEEHEGQIAYDAFHGKFAGYSQWMKDMIRVGRRQGYLVNSFGRVRRLPELADPSTPKWIRSRQQRQLWNFAIQGDAADVFKTAFRRVYRLLQEEHARTRIVIQVHDELDFYWHRDEFWLLPLVISAMEDFQFSVPLKAEAEWGPDHWGKLTELKA